MGWKDDNIERAIDGKQDGLVGNRLRVFVSGGELPIRRRWFKGIMLPLATGRGAKLIGFRAGVITPDVDPVTAGAAAILHADEPALAWLECRTWAIFGHMRLAIDPECKVGLVVTARPVYQTPPDVDPVMVLGFERGLIGADHPDPRVLAQYDSWLTRAKALTWTRALWVRDRLEAVLLEATP